MSFLGIGAKRESALRVSSETTDETVKREKPVEETLQYKMMDAIFERMYAAQMAREERAAVQTSTSAQRFGVVEEVLTTGDVDVADSVADAQDEDDAVVVEQDASIDQSAIAATDVHVEYGAPVILGALHRNKIDGVMDAHAAEIQSAASESGIPAGSEAKLRFTIKADGSVGKVKIKGSLGDYAAEARVKDLIRHLEFPKPAGGGVVIVTYPIHFA